MEFMHIYLTHFQISISTDMWITMFNSFIGQRWFRAVTVVGGADHLHSKNLWH